LNFVLFSYRLGFNSEKFIWGFEPVTPLDAPMHMHAHIYIHTAIDLHTEIPVLPRSGALKH